MPRFTSKETVGIGRPMPNFCRAIVKCTPQTSPPPFASCFPLLPTRLQHCALACGYNTRRQSVRARNGDDHEHDDDDCDSCLSGPYWVLAHIELLYKVPAPHLHTRTTVITPRHHPTTSSSPAATATMLIIASPPPRPPVADAPSGGFGLAEAQQHLCTRPRTDATHGVSDSLVTMSLGEGRLGLASAGLRGIKKSDGCDGCPGDSWVAGEKRSEMLG